MWMTVRVPGESEGPGVEVETGQGAELGLQPGHGGLPCPGRQRHHHLAVLQHNN